MVCQLLGVGEVVGEMVLLQAAVDLVEVGASLLVQAVPVLLAKAMLEATARTIRSI
jgi:hypothetical protein